MTDATARMAILGEIDVLEPDGEVQKFKRAMLITFDTVEEFQQANSDGRVNLIWYHDQKPESEPCHLS